MTHVRMAHQAPVPSAGVKRRALEVLAVPVGIVLALFVLAVATSIWPSAIQR